MNAKQGAALTIIILVVAIALVAEAYPFRFGSPASDVTYQEPASALHTSLRTNATDGTIALRLNGVSDASNPATSSAWVKFNNEDSGLYNFSLAPPPGDAYLVTNVTVTNVRNTEIPFTYEDFVLVTHDGSAYYPNYAVCSRGCGSQALLNRTLSGNFTSDLYVLFSVPAATQPVKLVYTASNPTIVMSSI